MDSPLVWSRGAIGDLLIHLPIAHAKYGDQPFNLIVSGPINNDTVKFLIESSNLNIRYVYHVDTNPRSSVLVTDKMLTVAYDKFKKPPDLILNHVRQVFGQNRFVISKADEIVDFPVDFTSVMYEFKEDEHFLSQFPKSYVLVCPYGTSNPLWKKCKRYHDYLREIVRWLVKFHGIHDLIIVGKSDTNAFDQLFWKIPKLKTFNMTNITTIREVFTLINHAKNFVVYDCGLKNYAFLQPTPTTFIWNKKWHAANPVEAWFPKQLQKINQNILLDIWRNEDANT